MRLTLKTINDELRKRGHDGQLERAGGYFYFHLGETADWLDRTVNVPTVNCLSLPEWITEFERLKNVNAQIMGGKQGRRRPNGSKAASSREGCSLSGRCSYGVI
jgi:hypothetical protein